MNIAEVSIHKSVITWTMTIVLIVVVVISFQNMSRLEDPEFTIKDAIVATPYPGASAAEVEEEVTNVIEIAIQELGQVEWIESKSMRGMSSIKVHFKDKYDKTKLQQVFDQLRRKVNDNQRNLPPGAGPSFVNDDYADVYGIFYALTGEGYSYREVYDYAKLLRRELLQVQDVKKIVFYGVQKEVIWVEMARAKMAALGISQEDIYRALAAKNVPADAGRLELGSDFIPINPTGEFKSEQEFGDLLITARGGGGLVYLRDVANITRGYVDPPQNLLRYDSKPAIGIAISTAEGGNVVTMGEGVTAKLKELESQTPVGMELSSIANQAEAVTTSIAGFMVNLIEAVIIVIVVLLFAMGLRSGLLIGGILVLTICGTFVFMQIQGVILERISLGALIIALGMLVDNAIVVVDGMKNRMEQGMDGTKAAAEVVGQTAIPLLGATFVAIMAFASIGTSQDNTGEYCRSLFTVILISLTMSWVTAVTTTPLVTKLFLKKGSPDKQGGEQKDPYAGKIFQIYKKLLINAMQNRWITVAVIVVIFVVSLIGFGFVKKMFFPNSTRPQFFIECYFPEGTHIRQTAARVSEVEKYLAGLEGVTHVSSAVGGGEPRFLLTYVPGSGSNSYGVVFVDVDDYRVIDVLQPQVQNHLLEMIPEAVFNVRRFLLGPGEGGKIQLRISGPDRTVLRQMARKAKDIMHESGNAKAIRDEWKEKVMVVRPQLAEAQARQLGITRPQVADALLAAFQGKTAGVYREGEELLPIIARAPEIERLTVDNIRDLQIWSPAAQGMIPMRQVVSGFTTETEDATIQRRNRATMIKIHSDPITGLPSELFSVIKPQIEKALNVDVEAYTGKRVTEEEFDATTIPIINKGKIPIKDMPGYFMAWGGEAEDSVRAQAGLIASLPIFFGMMVLVVIFLFNAFKQPLVIWLTVPLAIIGVTLGLLSFDQPFGFMALLGLLSLSGMLIKNAIVLVDQIDVEIASGKERFQAVVDSGMSRLNPVMMAALTTILGMIPLLQDAFFVAMAVTIMVGLAVATVLTLVVVPVLYTIFFKIPNPPAKTGQAEAAAS
jgi:multidrug efflux pump subunit AcrB